MFLLFRIRDRIGLFILCDFLWSIKYKQKGHGSLMEEALRAGALLAFPLLASSAVVGAQVETELMSAQTPE